MRGSGKALGALALLATVAAVGPATAAASDAGVRLSVRTVHGRSASASASLNVLTLNDQRQIDNRISAYIGPTLRLTLTAPEGLGDPDGSGFNCTLDNAKPGEESAQQVSCAPGYIQAIVGDLGEGNDTFNADPGLNVYVGTQIDSQRRPLAGGPGRDRLVGGAARDLLDGGGGPDSIVGGGEDDFLIGGAGADNLSGGAGRDALIGLGGNDRLNGGASMDVCRGGSGTDSGKSCEISRGL